MWYGGTIAKLASENYEIHTLIVTDGCTSQYRDDPRLDEIIVQKQKEAITANTLLGVKQVHFGNLPDMKLDTLPHITVNEVIEKVVREIKPDIVYTHFYGDVNLDHQMVYRSTLVAVRPLPNQCVKELYCYRVASSTEWSPMLSQNTFLPNVFCDISHFIDRKIDAIKAYQTELRVYPHPRSKEYVQAQDLSVGLKYGIGPAEEFMLVRKLC
ncbi:PIG-L deacetylase family protein [Cohnella faecalis]|uniref:PIG-L family deacetylase n=1 Tax=Cohnella faecalis TaxID=2315694 RepID=A0A398CSR9_9BACL|nr:PIG-L deacetylase family protein [Cohnella faecalis]RIE04299.1 PIG-L family deacetylase [Cohnella faecalis]